MEAITYFDTRELQLTGLGMVETVIEGVSPTSYCSPGFTTGLFLAKFAYDTSAQPTAATLYSAVAAAEEQNNR